MDLLYHHAKYDRDHASRAGCRKNVSFSSRFRMKKFSNEKVCANRNAMKQYNFQNNYGVIA